MLPGTASDRLLGAIVLTTLLFTRLGLPSLLVLGDVPEPHSMPRVVPTRARPSRYPSPARDDAINRGSTIVGLPPPRHGTKDSLSPSEATRHGVLDTAAGGSCTPRTRASLRIKYYH